MLLEFVALITTIASLLGLHAHFSLIKRPESHQKLHSDCGWAIAEIEAFDQLHFMHLALVLLVKIEAFDQLHFMHQAVRVCRTDHNDSIIARIACSFLLNKLPESMVKIEAFDQLHFMKFRNIALVW